jgi:hypothetical protein
LLKELLLLLPFEEVEDPLREEREVLLPEDPLPELFWLPEVLSLPLPDLFFFIIIDFRLRKKD